MCAVVCDSTRKELPPPVQLVQKSDGFTELLKKRINEWECPTCMIRNPNTKDSCMACETPNPQKPAVTSKPQPPISTFHFGIAQPGTNITVHGFSEDKPPVVPTPTFTFGAKSEEATKETTSSGFSFGIKSQASEKESSNNPVGLESSSDKLKPNGGPAFAATPTFSFGMKPAPLTACAEPKSQASLPLNPQSAVVSSGTAGLFGANVAKPASESLFGGANVAKRTSESLFEGSTKPEREVKTSAPVFGASSVSFGAVATGDVKPFSFGSTSDSKVKYVKSIANFSYTAEIFLFSKCGKF